MTKKLITLSCNLIICKTENGKFLNVYFWLEIKIPFEKHDETFMHSQHEYNFVLCHPLNSNLLFFFQQWFCICCSRSLNTSSYVSRFSMRNGGANYCQHIKVCTRIMSLTHKFIMFNNNGFVFFRDICKKIMIERSVQLDGSNGQSASKRAVRPTDLPTENRQRRMRHGEKELL
jgi:hypothetical protein